MTGRTILAGRCYLRALATMRAHPKGPAALRADRAWCLAGSLLAASMRRDGLDVYRDVDAVLRAAGMPETYQVEVGHTIGHAESSLFAATHAMPAMVAAWEAEGAYGAPDDDDEPDAYEVWNATGSFPK